VLWDSRDHMLTPHSGDLHELALMSFSPLIGSEYTFSTAVMDLRRYIPVTETHVLALELLGELQLGTVPFFKLATLGGEDRLRGLYEGRFRDKAMWVAQAEYRLPLWWRVGGIAHVGLGQVAASAADFGFTRPEWSLGFGLRMLLNTDEGLNLRTDFGISREGYGVYVGIGEAF
jgi:outer membrane protein assembly factor BamA